MCCLVLVIRNLVCSAMSDSFVADVDDELIAVNAVEAGGLNC